MNIADVFPIPVGMFDLDRKLNNEEIFFIKGQDIHNSAGNARSNNNYILESKELKKAREFCQTSLEQYFHAVYCPHEPIEVYITQSWVNYTKQGEHHHKHEHPNSFISGVFYINVDALNDNICFLKDTYSLIDIPPADWNQYNSRMWYFEVKTGRLLLFPSSLPHMVPQVTSDQERISISFNTFLKGNLGHARQLTELKLGERI